MVKATSSIPDSQIFTEVIDGQFHKIIHAHLLAYHNSLLNAAARSIRTTAAFVCTCKYMPFYALVSFPDYPLIVKASL